MQTKLYLTVSVLAVAACQGADKKPAAATDAVAPAPVARVIPATLTSPDPTALAAAAPNTFTVVFNTSKGDVEVAVDRSFAPLGADRLYYMANNGFFTGARFYRVVAGFMAQFGLSGIPEVDEAFDKFPLKDDPRKITNAKGTLAFATAGPNTRTTQMFINLEDNGPMLDPQGFAPVGTVTVGMDVVEKLLSGYGESSNVQGMIMSKGNEYLRTHFAELDSIVTASIKK
ncbi:MAG: peptidylprolyl isomerase [Gemmatimonadaceae bacterium]